MGESTYLRGRFKPLKPLMHAGGRGPESPHPCQLTGMGPRVPSPTVPGSQQAHTVLVGRVQLQELSSEHILRFNQLVRNLAPEWLLTLQPEPCQQEAQAGRLAKSGVQTEIQTKTEALPGARDCEGPEVNEV